MTERKPIGRKLRFEVFKRDKFTCQYCGAKAPDVILNVDHIHPVAAGGANDVLNLVTACQGCNAGKGARLIQDDSAIERQRAQMEALEARREQLRMMVEWRDELERVKSDTVELVAERVSERGHFAPNENGKSSIRKWLKKYTFDEVLVGVDEAFDIYMRWDGDDPNEAAWEIAFNKVPTICSIKRQSTEKPYLQKLFYIQGILRNRFRDNRGLYVRALEEMVLEWDVAPDVLEGLAKQSVNWDNFNDLIIQSCRSNEEEVDG